jgi:hypothetical protein
MLTLERALCLSDSSVRCTLRCFLYDRGGRSGRGGSRAGPADAAELDTAMDTYFAAR